MVAIDVFVGRLASRVMPAGQSYNLVIKIVSGKFGNHLARKLGQECHVVFRVNDERFLRPAGELVEIRHGTDREPEFAEAL